MLIFDYIGDKVNLLNRLISEIFNLSDTFKLAKEKAPLLGRFSFN